MARRNLLLALLVVLVGCDGDDVIYDGFECYRDMECEGAALASIANLDRAVDAPPVFARAQCLPATVPPPDAGPNAATLIGSGDTPFCECSSADDSGAFDLVARADECLVRGRARSCLFPAREAPRCDPNLPDACRTVCDDLHARMVEDATQVHDAKVRSNLCIAHACEFVVEIDDTCFANHSNQAQDCALTDSQMR